MKAAASSSELALSFNELNKMDILYGLLYVPIFGLAVLCLLRTLELFRNRRNEARGTLRKDGGALLAVALFTAIFAIMVVTHARSF